MTIPSIAKERIINYCGANMYENGRDFLKENPFFICYREWSVLKGICEGQTLPSYCVRILFDDKGIANSCCTCYTNRTMPCKHIAALLVLWMENPAKIPDRAQWSHVLRAKDKDELIILLEKVVDLYPEGFVGSESCIIES